MENNNLSQNDPSLLMEDWSKPEIKIIGIKGRTLGVGTSGSDCEGFSGTTSSCPTA